MIDNFDTVKKQLSELSGVINSFKSEAVQLRIMELILGRQSDKDQSESNKKDKKTSLKATSRRRRTEAKATDETVSAKKRKSSEGTGAVATLTQLVAGDFFKKPRTINDIIEHCKHKLARNFKANEFSGKLSRMVRNVELTREKNADNQYEYKKP